MTFSSNFRMIIDILYIFWHNIDFRYCLMALWKSINNMFVLKKKSFIIFTKENMSVLLKKSFPFSSNSRMKSPSKLKRVSKITEKATIRTSNHYQFLKQETIAFLVVYSIYGPNYGLFRKTVLHFFFLKNKIMVGMIIDILYIYWHTIEFR